MIASHPEVAADTPNKYQNWEVVHPEKWVPDGYACVVFTACSCPLQNGQKAPTPSESRASQYINPGTIDGQSTMRAPGAGVLRHSRRQSGLWVSWPAGAPTSARR